MIKVFNSTDKTYSTNGNIVLKPTIANVHKEDNGDFYLDLETIFDEKEVKIQPEAGTIVSSQNASLTITDADTLKEVELTKINGNTTQSGTPTPTTPQPINVVSGRQEVEVCGKNLINSVETNNFTNSVGIINSGSSSYLGIEDYVKCKPNTTYTITFEHNISNANLFISYRDKNNNFISRVNNSTSRTFTTPSNAYYMFTYLYKSDSFTTIGGYIQLEKGNTPSQYEDYKGQSYEINLGKNLFALPSAGSSSSVNYTINQDGTINLSGTATAQVNFYNYVDLDKTGLIEGQTYTFSTTKDLPTGVELLCEGYNGTTWVKHILLPLSSTQKTDTRAITLNTTNRVRFGIRVANGSNSTISNLGIQIEKGTKTSFEPYTNGASPNPDYPQPINVVSGRQDIVVAGKNLFDINGERTDSTCSSTVENNILTQTNRGAYCRTIWKIDNLEVGQQYTLNCNFINENGSSIQLRTYRADNSTEITRSSLTTNTSGNQFVIFAPLDTTCYIRFYSNTTSTSNEYTVVYSNIQLEKSSTATLYEPYKGQTYEINLGNIELCKIGNYQDKIYKEDGTWYIEKQIGKVILNGSERWNLTNTQPNDTTFKSMAINITGKKGGDTNVLMTHFLNGGISSSTLIKNATSEFFWVNGGTTTTQTGVVTTSQTTTAFKTWLSTNNVTVYYSLDTPTYTEITDSELIEQLNALRLLEGLNNISITSGDLAAEITIHYNYLDAASESIRYVDYLVPNNIVVANTPQGEQAFRITNVEKTKRKIKIKAYHVFYDTENYLIQDSYVVDKNCNDALDHLNNATDNTSPFTTISNITTIDSYRCVRKSLYEAIQVVIERWGGHLVRDNWTIGVYDTIGQDNGVTIRYGKNLKDITASYNWDEVVTKLLPVGKDGILLNALDSTASVYVESTTQYDIPYTKTISFSQDNISEEDYKDEQGVLNEEEYKQALVNDLAEKGQSYVQNNAIPKVNYTLSANVEKVSDVGDSVEVIDEKLGINIMTNIISYDYNCILNKYTQLEFGNFTPELKNLMNTITEETEKIIEEGTNTIKVTLTNELQEATSQIWNALGNSYVIYEGDKILIVDSLPKETATNVIMLNNGGIGFSQTGITGTFQSAWTIDNTLNMEQINVINLTADLIKGGTLKLGSNLNQNGQIEVYDESNSLIAELNKNGLKMYGVDGSYILMNNEIGFAGYDRNNSKIYWVDKDEFHMKKSVVEEEITLCNKMRFIPITITDSNNNIVNDGIGLVSVAGGGN